MRRCVRPLRPRRSWFLALVATATVPALAACAGSSGPDARATPVPTVPAPAGPAAPFTSTAPVTIVAAPAADAADAVRRYVTAEADGDWATSWSLLADGDRARAGSFEAWADEADERLPLRSIEQLTVDGSTIDTVVTLEARLDETAVVPGRARVRWRPVAAGGGWLVSVADTSVDPLLPDDAGAPAAAVAWVEARRQGATTGQYDGNLLGQPTAVEALPAGQYRAGEARPLDAAPDPQVAVQAFGPSGARLVRAVPVDGPRHLVVLTAPLGDRWLVVGVQAGG